MNKAKKYAVIVFCACFAVLSAVTFGVWQSGEASVSESGDLAEEAEVYDIVQGISAETCDECEPLYIVKTVGGRIAVCDYATGTVIVKSDIWTFTLPSDERERLDSGIIVADGGDLNELLDKYSS